MKSKSKVFMVLSGALVLMAVTGLLDESAYHYLEGISKKNLGFLALIVELKVIMSGIGDLVPFLKGHSGSLNDSIGKVENYLLLTSVVALVELMVLAICKSWVLKLLILLTFIFSIFGPPRSLATKLLILLLVLNPGLQLFSVSMQHLSKYATVDYGETYLSKLQLSVEKLKKEKAQLTQEHQKKITEINNGKKGVRFFSKLKEDISYDVDKSKLTIKGDFTELRSLVHDGGKELIKKISIFCSMVVFSLFLMPMGYALIVYTIFKSVEQELPATLQQQLLTKPQKERPGWKWHLDHWKGVFLRGKEEAKFRMEEAKESIPKQYSDKTFDSGDKATTEEDNKPPPRPRMPPI